MTLLELFRRFGRWDEGSKRQKKPGAARGGFVLPSLCQLEGSCGLGGLIVWNWSAPGHPEDTGGAVLAGAGCPASVDREP